MVERIKESKSHISQERRTPVYSPKFWSVYESTHSLIKYLKNETIEMEKNYIDLSNGAQKKN